MITQKNRNMKKILLLICITFMLSIEQNARALKVIVGPCCAYNPHLICVSFQDGYFLTGLTYNC